jgi:hypothetical protein
MFEASEIICLKNDGLLILSTLELLPGITCSLYQLNLEESYSIQVEEGRIVASQVELSPFVQCGTAFGP